MAKKMKKPKKVVKPTRKRPPMSSHNGYGIVGPHGNMWTSTVFSTTAQAKDYVRDFWRGVKGHDLTGYRVVWARQAAHYIREATGDAAIR